MARRKAEATRKKILNAAEKLFAEKGFDGTSVESVARSCGVNKALIYYYFKDKDDLIRCLFKNTYEELSDQIGSFAGKPDRGGPVEAGARLKRTISGLAEKKGILALLLMEELKNDGRIGFLFDYAEMIMGRLKADSVAGAAGRDGAGRAEAVELFLDVLPLLTFVALGEKWARRSECSPEDLTDMFVQAFDRRRKDR